MVRHSPASVLVRGSAGHGWGSKAWSIAVGLIALAGAAVVPALLATPVLAGGASVGGPSHGPSTHAAVANPPQVGQVTISPTGVSSNTSVVSTSGLNATVLQSFDGNITDGWAGSTLNGQGFTVNSVGYQANLNVIGIVASGITVKDVFTVSTGKTDGILVNPTVTSAAIESSTVTIVTGATTAAGIEAGNVFPSTVTEPTGTYVVTGNTVQGPGAGGATGEAGILVAGAAVSISGNTVSGFTMETKTTVAGNTFSSWFEDQQSYGIYAGCAASATLCSVLSNSLSGNSIGIVYTLITSAKAPITPAAATIEGNTVTNSSAYGLVVNATSASGTTVVEHNIVNNSVSGAVGALLIGTTYDATNNVFIGTSTTGTNGASQAEGSCASSPITTASLQASDCFSPVTGVTQNANVFEGTSAAYWSASLPWVNVASYLSGGELVTFSESGLPSGTPWGLTLAGTPVAVAAPSGFVGELQNGSQGYSVTVVKGWFEQAIDPSGALIISGSAIVEPTLAFVQLAIGQVVITTFCTSTNTTLVSTVGSVATVQEGFHGNITDYCPSSTLNGRGFVVNASGNGADWAAVSLEANGITVNDVATISTGYTAFTMDSVAFPQSGILVPAAVTSATIQGSTVTTTAAQNGPVFGIWAGNEWSTTFANAAVGSYTITGNTIVGPGGATCSALAGSFGILTAGASLTVSDNTVRGFSAVYGTKYYDQSDVLHTVTCPGGPTTGPGSGYNWWDGTQSAGIMAACSSTATTCLLEGNTLTGDAIGIGVVLGSPGFSPLWQPGPVTISGNTITGSGGYGVFAQMEGTDGSAVQAGAPGTSTITGNTINNTATGAPALDLSETTFSVTGNVLGGTTTAGDQGAWQDQNGYEYIDTAYVQATDTFTLGTTVVTLNANAFLGTTAADAAPLWDATFTTSGDLLSGGELATFSESGLATGAAWSVTADGTAAATAAPGPIVFDLQNGSYSYTVEKLAADTMSPNSGPLTVAGAALAVGIVFTPVTFTITFTESGLPASTSWSVIIDLVQESTTGTTITFTEPNGTYTYTASSPAGYQAAAGSVFVNGANAAGTVTFHPFPYAVTFRETGLPHGFEWWVNLTTLPVQSYASSTTTASFTEPNGSYLYHFGAENTSTREYTAVSGVLTVAGTTVTVVVTFTTLYAVTFKQSQLPYGVTWWVNVTGGSSGSSTGLTLTVWEANGAYSYSVATTDKIYAAHGGSFTVRGGGFSRSAAWHLVKYNVTLTEKGLPSGAKWCTVVTGAKTYCSHKAANTFPLPNGTYPFALTTPRTGFAGVPSSFLVAGAALAVPVVYHEVFTATFTESGLPTGTEWWVNVTGQPSQSSAGTTVVVPLLNGSYAYTIASANRLYQGLGGSFSVNGADVSLSVTFTDGSIPLVAGDVPLLLAPVPMALAGARFRPGPGH